MHKSQNGIVSLVLILFAIGVLIIGLGGLIFLRNYSQIQINKDNSGLGMKNKTIFKDPFESGVYINPKLKLVFKYPADWELENKVLTRKGDLNLSFREKAASPSAWYEGNWINIIAQKSDDSKLQELREAYRANEKIKGEEKTIGLLTGDLYTQETSQGFWRYKEDFLVDNEKFNMLMSLSISSRDKQKYQNIFQGLITSVGEYEKSGYKLPEYLDDNLVIDNRISRPSYITDGFTLEFEEQSKNKTEWWHSLYVTETSSGPNDLNVYVYRLGSPQGIKEQYPANAQNLIKEKIPNKDEFLKDGNAFYEEINVKGLKGFYISKTFVNNEYSYEEKAYIPIKHGYGDLYFETDKAVINISAGSHADFSKEELMKIAESMIH